MRLDDQELTENCRDNIGLLFGSETLAQAEALLAGEQRFLAIAAPGRNLEGCALHRRLLEAYDKAQRHCRP
jgi:ribosomal protein S12 methylthiotransferase accessory factor